MDKDEHAAVATEEKKDTEIKNEPADKGPAEEKPQAQEPAQGEGKK